MADRTAREILAGAATTTVKVVPRSGDAVLNVVLGASQEEAEAEARMIGEHALRRGSVVTWADGTKEWIERSAQQPDGPDSYVWHEDGDRIRVDRTRVTKSPDGARSERGLRPTWMAWDAYWEH